MLSWLIELVVALRHSAEKLMFVVCIKVRTKHGLCLIKNEELQSFYG